ncbi:hypothetical protein B0H15DRAFT_148421 [Mycena belliarum]|uniref:Uncharacterized protein n=1 Tax=Mycena belliarum TaxID=1033014 RepID=A0AAD6XUM4_9AGAR|nr:hypothetical protein B0H15DRAFT_148421 [Mycena belliae]
MQADNFDASLLLSLTNALRRTQRLSAKCGYRQTETYARMVHLLQSRSGSMNARMKVSYLPVSAYKSLRSSVLLCSSSLLSPRPLTFTTSQDFDNFTTMLTNLITLAVLVSVPLHSNASPLFGMGGRVGAATVTIFQCPTSTSLSGASASASSDVSASVSAGGASSSGSSGLGATAQTTRLLRVLRTIGPAISDLNSNVVPPVLSAVTSIVNSLVGSTAGSINGSTTDSTNGSTTGTTSGSANGSTTGSTAQVQFQIDGLTSKILSLTASIASVNSILPSLSNGAGSTSGANQIYAASQGLPAQITSLANSVGSVARTAGTGLSLTRLQSAVQSLAGGVTTMGPGLCTCAPTQKKNQLLKQAFTSANQAMNACLIQF